MSISVSVGVLADLLLHDRDGAEYFEKQVRLVDQILAENNKMTYPEPRDAFRSRISGPTTLSSQELRFLQRACAYKREGREDEFEPTTSFSSHDRRVMLDAAGNLDSHLLCHAGHVYATTVTFVDPIFDERLPGGVLVSSRRMLMELEDCASLLGIPLEETLGPWPGKEYDRLSESTQSALLEVVVEDPFSAEKRAWYCLFQAAVISCCERCLMVLH